jgi:hypothetical protein
LRHAHLRHSHLRHSGHRSGGRRCSGGRSGQICGRGHHPGVLARTLRRGGGCVRGRSSERLRSATARAVRGWWCGRRRRGRRRGTRRRGAGQRSRTEHAGVLTEFLPRRRRSGSRRRLRELRRRRELRPQRHPPGRRLEELRELAPFGRRRPRFGTRGGRRLEHARELARFLRLGSRRRPVPLRRHIRHRRMEHAREFARPRWRWCHGTRRRRGRR